MTRLMRNRFGGPAERAGRPEGCRSCVGGDDETTTGQRKVTRRRLACPVLAGAVEGGGLSGGAAAAGGRPHLGGYATSTSGGDLQGFSLSVEYVSTLFPT
jgi:hypothetical protein